MLIPGPSDVAQDFKKRQWPEIVEAIKKKEQEQRSYFHFIPFTCWNPLATSGALKFCSTSRLIERRSFIRSTHFYGELFLADSLGTRVHVWLHRSEFIFEFIAYSHSAGLNFVQPYCRLGFSLEVQQQLQNGSSTTLLAFFWILEERANRFVSSVSMTSGGWTWVLSTSPICSKRDFFKEDSFAGWR